MTSNSFKHISTLGDLAKPDSPFQAPNISGHSEEALRAELSMMVLIRIVEEKIADFSLDGTIKTPIHLGIGQEAIAVGVSRHLRSSDRVFGGHRSHSHYLALGGNLDALVAEIFCRNTGAADGRGGSMHLIDSLVGFSGSVPLVGATIPLGVGAALAAKMDGNGDVAVSYFGDGACEEGVLHESLNLANVLHTPMLFVVENNLYSSHLDIALRQPDDQTARYAKAHHIRHETVDGNDLAAVAAAAGRLISGCRDGQGPGFLEAITYRWRGHVGPDENIDVGVRRSIEEVTAWKKKDPIARLRDVMIQQNMITSENFAEMEQEETDKVNVAITAALASDFPSSETLLDHVYSDIKGQKNAVT